MKRMKLNYLIISCTIIDNNFKITLQNSHNRLSMVSLNCQSINAKFDQLKLFPADINSDSPISVICIQETWVMKE